MADISVSLTLDDSGFNKGLNNADKKVKQFGDSASKKLKDVGSTGTSVGNSISSAFGKLQGVIAGIGFGALIADSAKLATEIVSTAKALNMSTEAAVGFQRAVAAAGGDADNARDSLISLSQKLGEAKTQGGDALDAFNQLGISLTEIATSSPEQMMASVVKALAGVKDATLAADIQNRIFGEDLKNTDISQVSQQLEQYIQSAKKVAPALESARKAQLEFNNTYSKFQDELVQAIPWDSLSSGIKTIADNMEYIGNAFKAAGNLAKDLGSTFVWLGGTFAVFKGLQFVNDIFGSIWVSSGNLTKALIAQGGAFATIGTSLRSLGAIGPGIAAIEKAAGVTLTTFGRFGIVISAVLNNIVKMIPGIAQLVIAYQIFDAVVESVTGKDLAGWFSTLYSTIINSAVVESIENQIAALSKLMGIDYESEAAKTRRSERMKKAAEESLVMLEKEQEAAKNKDAAEKQANGTLLEKTKLIKDTAANVAQLTSSFNDQFNQQQQNIQAQIDMIGVGEDYKIVQQELLNLDKARLEKVSELIGKSNEAVGKPELQKEYAKGINDINAAYEKQKSQVEDLANAQVARVQVERMQQFATEQRIAGTQRIRDLENEQAKVFLPLIEQKYKDIEKAATDAITAQVEAEAKSRGVTPSDVPLSVVESITAEVRKQVAIEKEKAAAVEDTNNAYNLQKFALESITDTNSQVQKVYDDLAKLTLPELAQQEYDVAAAAKEHADQAIRAEEARRNAALSPEEAKAYYEAASRGSDKLIKAQKELYKQSRTFSTGWKQAMNDYVSQAGNAANHAKNIFNTMFSGLEDLLVNFVKTGKFEWKNFLATMLEELLRAQIQAVFAGMLGDMSGSMKGSSGGGILDSILGLFGGGKGKDGESGGILDSIWSGIKGLFGGDSKGKDGESGGILSDIWGGIKDIGGGVIDAISGIGGGISDIFSGIGGGGIMDGISSIGSSIMGIGTSIMDGVSGLFGGFGSSVSEWFKPIENMYASAGLSKETLSGMDQTTAHTMVNAFNLGFTELIRANSKKRDDAESKRLANSYYEYVPKELPLSSGGSSIPSMGLSFDQWKKNSGFAGMFANGGTIPSGSWGIVGEAGPEIVNGPANITPMSQVGGSTNVTYNINAIDSMSFKQMIAKDPSFIYGVTMQGAKGTAIRR
jgi:hypothetical protein